MAKGFTLAVNPWVYIARYGEDGTWDERFEEKQHATAEEEEGLEEQERISLLEGRNKFPDMPLINYTTQYGMGCFEGLKAFPQSDGTLKLFRPGKNAQRMKRSMEGLYMPPYPTEMFVAAVGDVAARNAAIGFAPAYDPDWEADSFTSGHAMYLRPFSYAEPGIGVGIPQHPWVVMVSTNVGAYFQPGNARATTTPRVRANPGGTGWIKCDANYVTSALAKREANDAGFMEAIFLDARERTYLEEGSSCNIFVVLEDSTLVTPSLEDTVLPGITRETVLELAADHGITAVERKISIDEVMSSGRELFATGTAAGVSFIESITHQGRTVEFSGGTMGETTRYFLETLKGIQYGAIEDTRGWMVAV